MKVIFSALLSCVAFQTASSLAHPASSSPLIGHWTLDVDTLPMPAAMRPKLVTLDFQEVDGKWASRVEITDQNNHTLYAESVAPLDGTPSPASGSYWVDVVAAKMPAPNVLIMQFVYRQVPSSTRVFSLSPDGERLTETETFFGDGGTPKMRTAFYARSSARH